MRQDDVGEAEAGGMARKLCLNERHLMAGVVSNGKEKHLMVGSLLMVIGGT